MPLSLNVTLPTATVTGGAVSTSTAQATSAAPSAPATPASVVTDRVTKAAWAMQMAETIYLNERQSTIPGAWVAYKVAYLFNDGNAVLVREPDCVTYTGPLLVADNLRRTGELYAD